MPGSIAGLVKCLAPPLDISLFPRDQLFFQELLVPNLFSKGLAQPFLQRLLERNKTCCLQVLGQRANNMPCMRPSSWRLAMSLTFSTHEQTPNRPQKINIKINIEINIFPKKINIQNIEIINIFWKININIFNRKILIVINIGCSGWFVFVYTYPSGWLCQ